MIQLIIGGVTLPETSNDKYSAYPREIGTQIDMISGRRVTESRGHVEIITYSYDYMGNDLMRQVLTVLRSGTAFTAQYLPDDSDKLKSSEFVVETMESPTFAFSRSGKSFWHNISFTLREVSPHD